MPAVAGKISVLNEKRKSHQKFFVSLIPNFPTSRWIPLHAGRYMGIQPSLFLVIKSNIASRIRRAITIELKEIVWQLNIITLSKFRFSLELLTNSLPFYFFLQRSDGRNLSQRTVEKKIFERELIF